MICILPCLPETYSYKLIFSFLKIAMLSNNESSPNGIKETNWCVDITLLLLSIAFLTQIPLPFIICGCLNRSQSTYISRNFFLCTFAYFLFGSFHLVYRIFKDTRNKMIIFEALEPIKCDPILILKDYINTTLCHLVSNVLDCADELLQLVQVLRNYSKTRLVINLVC